MFFKFDALEAATRIRTPRSVELCDRTTAGYPTTGEAAIIRMRRSAGSADRPHKASASPAERRDYLLHWPGARGRLAAARPDSKFLLLAQGAAQLEWPFASSKPLRVVGVVARRPPASADWRQGAIGGSRGRRRDRPARSDSRPGNARITVCRTREHGWSEAAASRRPGTGADGVSADVRAAYSDSITRADRHISGIRQCAPDHRSWRAGDASGAHSTVHRLFDHHRLPVSTRSQSS